MKKFLHNQEISQKIITERLLFARSSKVFRSRIRIKLMIKASTTVTIFYEKKKKNQIPPSESQEGGRGGRNLFSLSTSSSTSRRLVAHLETLLKGLHLLLFHASHVDEIGILDESWILWPIAATRARRATWTASIHPAKRWTTAGPNDISLYVLFEISFSNRSKRYTFYRYYFSNRCRHII